jgi:NADPH:quinone reductase
MKAWILDKLAGISHLRLTDLPDPVPQENEVVLQIQYAALNPADRYLAESLYPAKPPLPHILGRDGIGTVVQVGPKVTGLRVGDRRVILRGEAGINRPGSFAQRVSVPVAHLVEPPAGWSDQQAAGATLVYLTAYQALTMWGPLPPSGVVLVTGASGGVGVAAVQLAAAMGHTVLALSRSPAKGDRLRHLGATATFDPGHSQWRHEVKTMLAPRRVDLAIDNIGGKLLPEVIETLADLGKISLVGRLAGPVPNFNTAALFFRRIRMGGGLWARTRPRRAAFTGDKSSRCWPAPARARKWIRYSPSTNCPRRSNALSKAPSAKCCSQSASRYGLRLKNDLP